MKTTGISPRDRLGSHATGAAWQLAQLRRAVNYSLPGLCVARIRHLPSV